MSKIAIVGGGVAGLSAGIICAEDGHDVTVYEKHRIAGGNLTGWSRRGYTIDNCVHWLTGTNPVSDTYKMWEKLGVIDEKEIYRSSALYTYTVEGKSIFLHRDINRLEEEMLKLAPEDEGEIRDLIRVTRVMMRILGIGGESKCESIGPGGLVRSLPLLIKYNGLSVGELSKKFKSPLISGFVRAFIGECFASLALIFVYAHYCGDNADLPKGGSPAFASRFIERLTLLGGKLRLGCEVEKIRHGGGHASSLVLVGGEEIEADYFIVTSDTRTTFDKLLSIPMPKPLKKSYDSQGMKRFSSYQAAFAVELSELPFKGDYMFELSFKYQNLLGAKNLILREFSHEPSFAPDGCNIIQTMTFLTEEECLKFIQKREDSPEQYKAMKERLSERLKEAIEGHFPALSGKLSLLDIWTPATYKRYTGADIGSYMSFVLPKKTLPIRVSPKIDGLDNVYLATQWQMAPGGLPIAAEFGMNAAEQIKKAESKKRKY